MTDKDLYTESRNNPYRLIKMSSNPISNLAKRFDAIFYKRRHMICKKRFIDGQKTSEKTINIISSQINRS